MFADILDKPIDLTEVPELGSLGAAMCAGIGSGIFIDTNDTIDKCVKIKQTYSPNKQKVKDYQKAYERWEQAYEFFVKFY